MVEGFGASTSYHIKSTPGPYMFSAPPEFISLESMPVQLQWRLSYNTELQAGDTITWHIFRAFGTPPYSYLSFEGGPSSYYGEESVPHTVSEATKTVHIGVDPEPPPKPMTKKRAAAGFLLPKSPELGNMSR